MSSEAVASVDIERRADEMALYAELAPSLSNQVQRLTRDSSTNHQRTDELSSKCGGFVIPTATLIKDRGLLKSSQRMAEWHIRFCR